MINKYKQLSSDIIYQNPYWDYKHDKYIIPDGSRGDYYYVETPGSVMVIPHTDDNKFVFIKQFRYLNQLASIEFPGGGVKNGMTELEAAINELEEESGITAKKISKIGVFNPFNGVTNEICNVYIAEELSFGKSNPDLSEEFDILKFDFEQINALISTNQIWDGMTLSAWSLYYFSIIRSNQNEI